MCYYFMACKEGWDLLHPLQPPKRSNAVPKGKYLKGKEGEVRKSLSVPVPTKKFPGCLV